jgi:hypothetical protein
MRISDECDVRLGYVGPIEMMKPAKECGQLFAAVQYQIARLAGNAFFARSAVN